MTRVRRISVMLIGGLQCGIGGLAAVFVYLIYDSQPIREMLSIADQEKSLFMFILLVFGMLSILSGLLLVQEGNGGY